MSPLSKATSLRVSPRWQLAEFDKFPSGELTLDGVRIPRPVALSSVAVIAKKSQFRLHNKHQVASPPREFRAGTLRLCSPQLS